MSLRDSKPNLIQKFTNIPATNKTSKFSHYIHWFLLLCSIDATIYNKISAQDWEFLGVFKITSFTLLIWSVVLFFWKHCKQVVKELPKQF